MSEAPVLSLSADFLVGHGEMVELIRSKDWSATALGPIDRWPQSLRTTVSLCLASNFPINIVWGEHHSQIYNDGYRVVCGDAHPTALGQDYSVTWASAWPAIGEPFERALAGETSFLENQRMFLTRNGYLEETFFTFSTSPIRDESGGIGGLFHPVAETTSTMLAERRTRALRDLAGSVQEADTPSALFERVLEAVRPFAYDLPFLVAYSLSADGSAYNRVGGVGLAPNRASNPETLGVDEEQPWPILAVSTSRKIVELNGVGQTFAGEACGPYDELPDAVFIIPLAVHGSERAPALMVAGVSPRLPMNDDYRGFFELLAATVSGALSTVRAREEERRRAEALAALDEAKTAFFSNVSHEFRTPLTLMLGPIEDALGDGSDLRSEQRERLEVAHRNALRLLKLVNALLDFSRIEAGRSHAAFQPTDLAALTTDLASNFRSAFDRAGLELRVTCSPLSEPVFVDRDMWEKITLNLLSNAFKFTLKGEVRLSLYEDGGSIVMEVCDTGVGIDAEELPRVFDRFHRIAGQRGRSHEGSGIGLSLVKELVALHDGAITASSRAGQGTTFRVVIPRKPSAADDRLRPNLEESANQGRSQAFVEEASRWLPDADDDSSSARHAPPLGARPKVVLADDNADMRAYVKKILEDGGYEVIPVENGLSALEAVKASPPPDLLVSDVMMPGMDGFELLRRLRRDPVLSPLYVVLLSARAGEEARVEGLAAGADDYLVKPFSARELRARVDGAIKLVHHRREAARQVQKLEMEFAVERERVALRSSEDKLQTALEAGRMGSWSFDVATMTFEASSVWREIFGVAPTGPVAYERLRDLIHPDDRARQQQGIDAAIAEHAPLDLEYRLVLPDGGFRWVMVRGKAEYDPSGAPRRVVGVTLDITDRKLVEERQTLLLDELNHRVKNTLSTVQSITTQTYRTSENPQAFTDALISRVQALARAHDLLTRTSWDGASLEDVIGLTLAPYRDINGPQRVSFSGPPIRVSPNAAVTLNMAFHELATNAAKYGALSVVEGATDVTWSVDTSLTPAIIELVWCERHGPAVSEPPRRGFGSRLLEHNLARELAGTVTLEFEPAGLVCRMRLNASQKLALAWSEKARIASRGCASSSLRTSRWSPC